MGDYQELQCSEPSREWMIPTEEDPSCIRPLLGCRYREPPESYLQTPLPKLPFIPHTPSRPVVPMSSFTSSLLSNLNSPEQKLERTQQTPTLTETSSKPSLSRASKPKQPKSKTKRRSHDPGYQKLSQSESNIPAMTTQIFPTLPEAGSNSVSFHITVYKRSNGNQPWEASNISPPMLGKMRKIIVQLGTVPTRLELLFQCKDMKRNRHEGKLV